MSKKPSKKKVVTLPTQADSPEESSDDNVFNYRDILKRTKGFISDN